MKEKFVGIRKKVKESMPEIRRVWDGYGYYISLAVLLIMFGTIAYMYRTGYKIKDAPENDVNFSSEARAVMAYATPAPTATPEPEKKLKMPVNGEIIGEFSSDELVWNETLGQWQAHPGVDIAAPMGAAVAACGNGVITGAYEDAMWGNTVEITHDNGSVSRVCPLVSLELAKMGAAVRRGDIIGSIGELPMSEADMESHLHFEYYEDGTPALPEFDE